MLACTGFVSFQRVLVQADAPEGTTPALQAVSSRFSTVPPGLAQHSGVRRAATVLHIGLYHLASEEPSRAAITRHRRCLSSAWPKRSALSRKGLTPKCTCSTDVHEETSVGNRGYNKCQGPNSVVSRLVNGVADLLSSFPPKIAWLARPQRTGLCPNLSSFRERRVQPVAQRRACLCAPV